VQCGVLIGLRIIIGLRSLADDEIEGEIIVYQPQPLSAVTEHRLANINLAPMEEPDNGTRTSGIAAEYACMWASGVAPLPNINPSCTRYTWASGVAPLT
jgi:hypothetical protein